MTRGFTDEDKPRRDDDEPSVYEPVVCIHATEKAILCRFGDGTRRPLEVWIPQAAVSDDSEVYAKGHSGKLVVKAFFVDTLAEKGVERS